MVFRRLRNGRFARLFAVGSGVGWEFALLGLLQRGNAGLSYPRSCRAFWALYGLDFHAVMIGLIENGRVTRLILGWAERQLLPKMPVS